MTRSEKRRPGSARVVIVFPGAIELGSGGEGAGVVEDHGWVGEIFRSVPGHGRVQALPALVALFLWHPRNRRSFTTSIDSPSWFGWGWRPYPLQPAISCRGFSTVMLW